jgi:putative pyoverdin transport system ATP-binding/permease protein
MRLIRLFSHESLALFTIAIFASIVSGLLTMGTLVVLFRVLRDDRSSEVRWLEFVALAGTVLFSRRLSQVVLGHISRKAFMDIRVRLARQVLDAPLLVLE